MGIHSESSEGRNSKVRHSCDESSSLYWEIYIAAVRGNRTSIAPDIHKIKAENARHRAEERFFRSRHTARHLLRKKY